MELFGTLLTTVSALFLGACIVILWRNNMVYAARTRRLREVSEASKAYIRAAGGDGWENYYREYERLTYPQMLWDFRKWSYRQFYPKSVEESAKRSAWDQFFSKN